MEKMIVEKRDFDQWNARLDPTVNRPYHVYGKEPGDIVESWSRRLKNGGKVVLNIVVADDLTLFCVMKWFDKELDFLAQSPIRHRLNAEWDFPLDASNEEYKIRVVGEFVFGSAKRV